MKPEALKPAEREVYGTPEIVSVGSALELTQGMGGDSSDTGGWTIPVKPVEGE